MKEMSPYTAPSAEIVRISFNQVIASSFSDGGSGLLFSDFEEDYFDLSEFKN